MNSKDAVATEPLAVLPAVHVKELATMSPKAATTSNNTNHAKMVNKVLHFLPMFSSITAPIDKPLCLIDAKRAPKS